MAQSIIVLTIEQEEEIITKAVKKALLEIEEERKAQDFNKPQELTELLKDISFKSYNTDHWIYTLKKEVKAGKLGRMDRYNKYMVSYNELYNFLFKRK